MLPSDTREYHQRLNDPIPETASSMASLSSAARDLLGSSLLALGTFDTQGRPWTTIWGGERGFTRQMAPLFIGVKVQVDYGNDPVVEALLGTETHSGEVDFKSSNAMVSALAINLQDHRFLNFSGKMVAGSLSTIGNRNGETKMLLSVPQDPGTGPFP